MSGRRSAACAEYRRGCLPRREDEVVLQVPVGSAAACSCQGLGLIDPAVTNDQRRLDAADGVTGQVRIVVGEQLGDDALVAGGGGDDVNVGGPHVVTAGDREQLPYRAVRRYRVADGLDRPQVIAAVRAGPEPAAEVVVRLGRVDVLVQAVAVGAPDVQDGTADRNSAGAEDTSVDPGGLPVVGASRDIRAAGLPGRAFTIERTEHTALQGAAGHVSGLGVDHHGQAENVGKQDELVPCLVADLAASPEEVCGGQQLPGLEPDLACQVVSVPDNGGQNSPRARTAGTAQRRQDLSSDLLAGERSLPCADCDLCEGTGLHAQPSGQVPEDANDCLGIGPLRVVRVHE